MKKAVTFAIPECYEACFRLRSAFNDGVSNWRNKTLHHF